MLLTALRTGQAGHRGRRDRDRRRHVDSGGRRRPGSRRRGERRHAQLLLRRRRLLRARRRRRRLLGADDFLHREAADRHNVGETVLPEGVLQEARALRHLRHRKADGGLVRERRASGTFHACWCVWGGSREGHAP